MISPVEPAAALLRCHMAPTRLLSAAGWEAAALSDRAATFVLVNQKIEVDDHGQSSDRRLRSSRADRHPADQRPARYAAPKCSEPDAALKLLHSTTLRIGDRSTQTSRCRRVRGLADRIPEGGSRPRTPMTFALDLTAMAPPGAAGCCRTHWRDSIRTGRSSFRLMWCAAWSRSRCRPSPSPCRMARRPRSPYTLGIRAHYYPDPGTTDMPAPVHGDIACRL